MTRATREPTWLAEIAEEGATVFRIGRDGELLVAEWIGLARLVARRDGTDVRFEPAPDADPRDVSKVENGSVPLLLRHLAGMPALHGAAVEHDGEAIVLLGKSGQGKSTLTAALCTSERISLARGASPASLVADDAVTIDRDPVTGTWLVTARETHHWIDADARDALGLAEAMPAEDAHHRDKAPVAARSRSHTRAEVVAFVELTFGERGEAPRLERLGPIDAMGCLVPQAVRFVLDEPERHRRELEVLASMVEAIPMYRLVRPRDLSLLGPTAQLVATLLTQGANDP